MPEDRRSRPIVIGNWKMFKTPVEGAALAREVAAGSAGLDIEVGIAPSYPALTTVAGILSGSRLHLVGQDAFFEPEGAYTGAVSAPMLAAAGCSLVLAGHSERRLHFGEGDRVVRKKVEAILAAGMSPVLCIGETLGERDRGAAEAVVRGQLEAGISGLSEEALDRLLVAYEPVWAIGTGRTATPEAAEDMHRTIREAAAALVGGEAAAAVPFLYGGSVKGDNAARILAGANVDGVLVGGASLGSSSFLSICRNAS